MSGMSLAPPTASSATHRPAPETPREKCTRRLRALAARLLPPPVRLLLAFAAYYGTSCCIYGYLEEPGWTPTDSIYLATMVMSTVGYGDKHPDTPATRALTVPLAYLGFVL